MKQQSLQINLPASWAALSDEQLTYVYNRMLCGLRGSQLTTFCALRFAGIEVLQTVPFGHSVKAHIRFTSEPSAASGDTRASGRRLNHAWVPASEIARLAARLDYLLREPVADAPIRISQWNGHAALPADFDGVPFKTYLMADNLFVGYLKTQQVSLGLQLAALLYDVQDEQQQATIPTEIMYSAVVWYHQLKRDLQRRFSHLFTVSTGQVEPQNLPELLRRSVDEQLYVLTDGDLSKEADVLQADTLRALSYLDQKAELAQRQQKKK